MSMLKKELVDHISDDLDIQKQDVAVAVDIILDSMVDAIADGRRVELRGFGSFSTRSRKAPADQEPAHRRDHGYRRAEDDPFHHEQVSEGRLD